MPQLAKRSLSLYASAVVEALVSPPPEPKEKWREVVGEMAELACENYRATVRHDEEFVPYFRVATPEQELGKLPLGSRPAKRKPSGGIESLRAIPWIFAWAQTRLVLPSWLGVMRAIEQINTPEKQADVQEMIEQWPFFASRLSMLDMVFKKADPSISKAYDERLVPDNLMHFGEALRKELRGSMKSLDTKAARLSIPLLGVNELIESMPKGAIPVAVELVEDATPLPAFEHPKNAFYIFGPEDGSLTKSIVSACQHTVYIPTQNSMNLAVSVNVVLYDRLAKSDYPHSNQFIRGIRDVNNNL